MKKIVISLLFSLILLCGCSGKHHNTDIPLVRNGIPQQRVSDFIVSLQQQNFQKLLTLVDGNFTNIFPSKKAEFIYKTSLDPVVKELEFQIGAVYQTLEDPSMLVVELELSGINLQLLAKDLDYNAVFGTIRNTSPSKYNDGKTINQFNTKITKIVKKYDNKRLSQFMYVVLQIKPDGKLLIKNYPELFNIVLDVRNHPVTVVKARH